MARGIVILGVLVALVGCGGDAWTDPSPDDTFERFLLLQFMGKEKQAYAMISPEDRAVLERTREELKSKLKAADVPEPHEMLLISQLSGPYSFKRIKREGSYPEGGLQGGERVTLQLEYYDGREQTASMVWGGDRWYVDLQVKGTR